MSNNLYSAYIQGGQAEGEYKKGIRNVEDTWSEMDYSSRQFQWEREKTSRGVEAISTAVELASTLYGGWQDKQKFEGESMPAAQQMIAEKSYDPEKHGGIKWSEFQKGDKYQDYLSKFAPKKVEMGLFESMFAEEPLYDIAGKQFKKSEISLMGRISGAEKLSELLGTDVSNVLSVEQNMFNEVKEKKDEAINVINSSSDNVIKNQILKIISPKKEKESKINQIDFNQPYTMQVIK
tara:strand:- start:12410 stop:13117 length:708 start_codon:yes stop_codon:yes gene_type:complete